jgi:hypothetical protein
MTNRIEACNTWWNGKDEAERFLLYYTCLRHHYQMPAAEALATAKKNWSSFGEGGDLISTIRKAIRTDEKTS